MPSYEVALIVRSSLQRNQLKDVLKLACKNIFNQGGVIRKMENLGQRELPHPIKRNTHGNYYCIQFDSSPDAMAAIGTNYDSVEEIIRHGIIRREEEPRRPCLDGPCLFGEIPNPDHDRAAYTRRVLQRYKNKDFSNV